MSKQKRFWYKWMHEWLTAPAIQRLPDNLWRRYMECMTLASIENEDGFLPHHRDMAYTLRVDEQTLIAELRQLSTENLLDFRDYNPFEKRWFVVPYEDSQAPSKAAIRQRRYRERQKQEEDSPRTIHVTR